MRDNPGESRSALIELNDIDWLIANIEAHWDALCGECPDEAFRRDWVSRPNLISPAQHIVDALMPACGANEQGSTEYDYETEAKKAAISTALLLAARACRAPLTESDLNRLGWQLTRLVALDIQPLKDGLRAARQAGGVASGESRRAANAARDAAICSEARRLLSAGRNKRELAGIIAIQKLGGGLSKKRINQILVAGGIKGN